jgi:RIO-like serine/threonine protein kinase
MIYDYCLQQIETTKPYVHGDWVLSNMIITDRGIRMIDWDNLGIYDSVTVYTKLEKDMISAFGKERFERIK